MVEFNHIVGYFTGPLTVACGFFLLGWLLLLLRKKKAGITVGVIGVVVLWSFSTEAMLSLLSKTLARAYPPTLAEAMPNADAIGILGGGIGRPTGNNSYPELFVSSDRVWHAARLWTAGKAPIVVASGSSERIATVPFLRDLGVPEEVIAVDDVSRNTEENAKYTEALLRDRLDLKDGDAKPKILLVTSAWHMRRALLMFSRYAPNLDVIPAPTDYEMIAYLRGGHVIWDFLPSAEALMRNSYLWKEIIGYWGYRFFRK